MELKSAKTLVVVEGEFKALALWGQGIHAVGIKGFFGATNSGKSDELHPELAGLINEMPDLCVVEFLGDADTALNKDFCAAAMRFAEAMRKERATIEVSLPRLCLEGPKGIDDAIDEQGAVFRLFWEQLPRIRFSECPQGLDEGAFANVW